MKKLKTALATIVVLAAGVGTGLLAADTDATKTPKTPNDAKTTGQSSSGTLAAGWYGTGYDGNLGYFNPARSGQANPYPFYNIVGGETYGALYELNLPDQNESPLNPQAALTRHSVNTFQNNAVVLPIGLSLRTNAARVAPTHNSQNPPAAADSESSASR
jgi:hypothetical protein